MDDFRAEIAALAKLRGMSEQDVLAKLDSGLTRALHHGLPKSVFAAQEQKRRERLSAVGMARKGDCV